MPVLETLVAGGKVLGALGGLFGGKKAPSPSQNIVSQAKGARQAAEKYGFNPLTMLQYGQPGGAMGGGAPPLASMDFLAQAVDDFKSELNGDADRQRQADQLNLDLARIKMEQARSGVVVVPSSAANAVGGGSPLGVRPSTVAPSAGVATVPLSFGSPVVENSALTPGRDRVVKPQENQSGIIEIDNALTGPVKFLGSDGEIFMEYLQVPIVGAPQVAWNWGTRFGKWASKQEFAVPVKDDLRAVGAMGVKPYYWNFNK